jgi:hypothetical protein
MRIGRDFWQAMNSRRLYFNHIEAETVFERLASVSKQLNLWHENTIDAPEKFLTMETYEDIMLICRGIPPFMSYVWEIIGQDVPDIGFSPKMISQDSLESTFGDLRQRGGGTQNITVLSVAYNLRTINCNILNAFLQAFSIDV